MVGVVIFGVSSLACGLSTNAPVLIIARFAQGVGAAALLACQIALLSHQFPNGNDRGMAFSWWGIIFGMGLGFGPLVGGVTVAFASWEWVFLAHVLLAVVTFALARVSIIESSDPQAVHIDFAGIATLSLAVFCLVYLITRGQPLHTDDLVGICTAILVFSVSLLLLLWR